MDEAAPRTRKRKAVTIYDVAKRARVSIKTVSMVLNNLPAVKAETRARVQDAIDALAYHPNQLARGLASHRSFMLGLFCDGNAIGSNYIARIQMEILKTCQKEGYHLVIEYVEPSSPNLARQVQSLMVQSDLAGGILTPPLSEHDGLIEALKHTDTPIARYSPERSMPGFIDVDMDNVQAGYDMAALLLSLGHRRIGFVHGEYDHADARARFAGFRRAMAEWKVPVDESLCLPGEFTYKSGMDAGDVLLSLPERPTAILAANDDMAAGVLAASLRFNLRVPEDLSIAGFDDSLFSQAMWPRLTTCRQPLTEMTEAVVAALIRNEGVEPAAMVFPHKVIVRQSTAAPAEARF
jgi:LacI family transcriptional regulator